MQFINTEHGSAISAAEGNELDEALRVLFKLMQRAAYFPFCC
jgi:hypothetical protein